MTREEILARIVEIAEAELERREEITEATRLGDDLRLDSIGLLTLAIEVENRFRIRLDEQGAAGIETVGELIDVISGALADEAPGEAT